MADDIKVAVQRFTVDGTLNIGNNIDLTISGLGWTPKAVAFYYGTAASGGSAAHLSWGMGAADATNEWGFYSTARDSVGTTESQRNGSTARCLFLSLDTAVPSATRLDHSFNSFISNGVRITSQTNVGDSTDVLAVFFGGADLQAHVGIVGLGTGTSAIDVTAPGFEPNLLLTGTFGDDFAAGSTNFFAESMGAVANGGNQKGVCYASVNGSATANVNGRLLSNRVGAQITSSQTPQHDYLIDTFDANGFSVTSSASAGNDDLGYIAVYTGDRAVSVDTVNAPTSAASDWDVTAPGFEPQSIIMLSTIMEAEDNTYNNNYAGSLGVAVFDDTREAALTGFNEDAAATTNTGNQASSNFLYLTDDDDTVLFQGNNPTFESTGFSIAAANITTANATQRKFVTIAIEAVASAATSANDEYYKTLLQGGII